MKHGVGILAGLLGAVVGCSAVGAAFGPASEPVLPPAFAEDADSPDDLEPDEPDPSRGPALTPEQLAAARTLLQAARETQERHQYGAARKKFEEFLETYPGAPDEMRLEAEERSADNCFLGFEEIRSGGPSGNRIDVELMGDGYLINQQDRFRK